MLKRLNRSDAVGGQTYLSPRNRILDGIQIPREVGLLRGYVPAHYNVPTHECISLFACRFGRMCLSSSRGGRTHSPPRGMTVTKRRCGLLPHYFGHVVVVVVVIVVVCAHLVRRHSVARDSV